MSLAAPRIDVGRSRGATAVTPAGRTTVPVYVALRRAVLGIVLLVAILMRFPALDRVPNGFFLDEASRGYDAYSLATTGADQYGVRRPLFAEGLDDYTPALFTYLAVPFVAVLGPAEWAVRLPAALAGTATVGLTYLLAARMLGPWVGIGAAALLAISPWHVLPSRTGAEWILLPLFTVLGIWLLDRGRQDGRLLLGAGAILGIGLYSYAFARLLIPLLLAGYLLLFWRELRSRWRWALAGLAALVVLALPILQFGATPAGQARLRTVVPLDRLGPPELLRYFGRNFASYFSPEFLIWGAEPTNHHRLAGFGPLLPLMVPLALIGLAVLLLRPSRAGRFWLWWLVAAPLSSALHRESPSSALLLGAIPAWHVVSAVGGAWLVRRVAAWRPVAGRVAIAILVACWAVTAELAAQALYADYPVYAAADWEHGAREVVRFLEAERGRYDGVLVSDRLGTPHILVLFYAPVDPRVAQSTPIHVRQPNVRSRGIIGPYRFGRTSELLERPGRHLVWVGADEARPLFRDQAPLLTVRLPDGRPAHAVYAVERI